MDCIWALQTSGYMFVAVPCSSSQNASSYHPFAFATHKSTRSDVQGCYIRMHLVMSAACTRQQLCISPCPDTLKPTPTQRAQHVLLGKRVATDVERRV
eukprot:IDg3068t1